MDAEELIQALRQGVFENNRRLARTLAEWGGPLEQGQVRTMLQQWAFGSPRPVPPAPPEALPERRPRWREVPPGRRAPFETLHRDVRTRWVARLTEEVRALAEDVQGTLARYAARPDTGGGRIVSGDTLLRLIPSVAENPPLALAALRAVPSPVLAGLSGLTAGIRDQALALVPGEPVILLAGAHATGKSTLCGPLIRRGFPGAIIDSPWAGAALVQALLEQAHPAWVVHVRRGFEEAFQSMVLRAADDGRMVDPGAMIRAHQEIPRKLREDLAAFHGQSRVSCWHLGNTGTLGADLLASGGPMDGAGREALAAALPAERSRADLEQAARNGWARFQGALQARLHNPYPADLAYALTRAISCLC